RDAPLPLAQPGQALAAAGPAPSARPGGDRALARARRRDPHQLSPGTGRGVRPRLDVAGAALPATHRGQRQRLRPPRPRRAAGRPFTEQDEIVPSARTPGMVNVYYRTYATKDDVVGVACVSPGLQRAFMEVLGLVDDAPRGADRAALERRYTGLAARCEKVLAS